MKTLCYEFILEAATATAHHSETFGNTSIFMTKKMRRRGGGFCNIPIVTADTLRHVMRETSSLTLLDLVGLGENALSESAMRLLFNGGMVTGRGDASSVSLDAYRKMVDLVPTLGLFGGCADNRVIPGRLIVGDAILASQDTAHLFPDWVHDFLRAEGEALDPMRGHLTVSTRVRGDSTLDPGMRNLLTAEARAQVEQRLLASENAHHADDAVERAASKSTQLPYSYETLCIGSLFFWRVQATCYSELDEDTFHVALGTALARMEMLGVAGKRGAGNHGCLRVRKAWNVEVLRPSRNIVEFDSKALGMRKGTLFQKHVTERAPAIRDYLRGVNA